MNCQDCGINESIFECTKCKRIICGPCAEGSMFKHDCKDKSKEREQMFKELNEKFLK